MVSTVLWELFEWVWLLCQVKERHDFGDWVQSHPTYFYPNREAENLQFLTGSANERTSNRNVGSDDN